MGRLHRLSFLSVLIGPAFAQITYPNCSAGWEWSYNTLDQNPCNVAASLEAWCNGGQFEIPQLPPGRHYGGPDVGEDNSCTCNTVTYSLVSACAACQGSSTWVQWTSWSTNCSTVAPPSIYPNPIPSDTRVPHWAYIDVVTANNWTVAAAQSAGDSPEATPAAPSTTQPSPTASSSPNSNQHKSHAGVIAGAIVGVAGVALLTASIFWYFRRRRRLAGAQPSSFEMPEPKTSMSFGRLYDPNDPETFPEAFFASLPTVTQTTPSAERANPINSQGRGLYSGLPLV